VILSLTFPIEQDNSDVRHHLARFRRRSKHQCVRWISVSDDIRAYRTSAIRVTEGNKFKPALSRAEDPDAPRRLVRYRLNRVAQAELFTEDFERRRGRVR
jgi:hypothetical protein